MCHQLMAVPCRQRWHHTCTVKVYTWPHESQPHTSYMLRLYMHMQSLAKTRRDASLLPAAQQDLDVHAILIDLAPRRYLLCHLDRCFLSSDRLHVPCRDLTWRTQPDASNPADGDLDTLRGQVQHSARNQLFRGALASVPTACKHPVYAASWKCCWPRLSGKCSKHFIMPPGGKWPPRSEIDTPGASIMQRCAVGCLLVTIAQLTSPSPICLVRAARSESGAR